MILTMSSSRKIGLRGEKIAVDYLKKQGYQIIGTNFHSRFGEIDIMASRNEILHIIEVKTRVSNSFGHPAEALCRRKLQAIFKTATIFISQSDHNWLNLQIDLIAINLDQCKTNIIHYKNLSLR